MDLLMVSDVYFPRVNGVSTSIRTFARALVAMGHRVTLVAPDYGMPEEQAARDAELGPSFEVLRVPARVLPFDPEDRLMTRTGLREGARSLSGRRFDAVHIHTPFRAHGFGVRMAKGRQATLVETYHTYFEHYAEHYLPWAPAWLLRWAARRVSLRLCRQVDHLIVPTREMEDVLRGYGVRTPATVLPTGIDLDEFQGGDGARFRASHGLPQAVPVLVTVSRVAVEKNIAFLIRVVRRLVDTTPELRLVIAGEGPDEARLRQLVRDQGLLANVVFVGNLDRRSTLLDCYRAGDAFVFASPTETQGLVLLEAMALGVPIVSTAQMGTATVLRHAQSALVSPPDEALFAMHVRRLLRDGALRDQLAAAGPADAARWDNRRLMERALAIYAGTQGHPHPAAAWQQDG
jgi:glycosyltransferase involved in cell wall biosynthesis